MLNGALLLHTLRQCIDPLVMEDPASDERDDLLLFPDHSVVEARGASRSRSIPTFSGGPPQVVTLRTIISGGFGGCRRTEIRPHASS